MSDNDNTKRGLPVWLETGTATALLIPLFYTAGWSYAYHYFECFNLGLTGLEIPREYFFLYSYWAMKDQFVCFLLALLFYVSIFFLGRFILKELEMKTSMRKLQSVIRLFPTILIPLMVLSIFFIFYYLGDRAAGNAYDEQARNDFPSYPRVRVWAEAPKKANLRDEMKQEWQKGCYRLLIRNKDNLFLFYGGQSGDKLPTDIIPAGKIELVRVLPQYMNCEE